MRLLNRVDATVKLQICHVACRNGFHSVKQSADRVHAWHIAHLAAQVRTELTSSSNMHKSIEHHAPLTGRVTWRLAHRSSPPMQRNRGNADVDGPCVMLLQVSHAGMGVGVARNLVSRDWLHIKEADFEH